MLLNNNPVTKRELSEAELSVVAYLKSVFVETECFYCGVTTKMHTDGGDLWRVTFSKGKAREPFEFTTGSGHRWTPKKSVTNWYPDARRTGPLNFKHAVKKWIQQYSRPDANAANPAAVLHCLILDSQANETSFTNWCGEFGFDDDSISALATYNACCENAKKLNTIFSKTEQQHIAELLQDY